jgi:hypothetical protein
MKEKRAPNKIENNINEKKHLISIEDFIIKQHENSYPKGIKGLFERLGIE